MTEVITVVEDVINPDVNGNGDVTAAVLQAAFIEEQALEAGGKKPARAIIASPGDTMGPLE